MGTLMLVDLLGALEFVRILVDYLVKYESLIADPCCSQNMGMISLGL